MRIIAGEKKGFRLFSLPGDKTRPTKDFVKEAIFDIIFDCEGLRVLDLYSGCGSLGFEALSRGAEFVDLVDFSDKAVRIMKKNIDKLNYLEQTGLHKQKADTFLKANLEKYDLIFADPPYNKDLVNKTIESVIETDALDVDGWFIIEHSDREKIEEKWEKLVVKQKKYGHTTVTIIAKE